MNELIFQFEIKIIANRKKKKIQVWVLKGSLNILPLEQLKQKRVMSCLIMMWRSRDHTIRVMDPKRILYNIRIGDALSTTKYHQLSLEYPITVILHVKLGMKMWKTSRLLVVAKMFGCLAFLSCFSVTCVALTYIWEWSLICRSRRDWRYKLRGCHYTCLQWMTHTISATREWCGRSFNILLSLPFLLKSHIFPINW